MFSEDDLCRSRNQCQGPFTCPCLDAGQVANTVSVWNDGPGIPVEKHKTEKVWLPEMIFGQLLTGSNYDDDEKKVRTSSCSSHMSATIRLLHIRGSKQNLGSRGFGVHRQCS